MDLLILLVESRRQLVSRSDIVERLWGKDVFVDVETGVNTAISKVRQALRDSPDAPAFVETVPGKGYRFIADVEVVSAAPDGRVPPGPWSGSRRAPEQTSGVISPADLPTVPRARTSNPARLAIGLGLVAMVTGWPPGRGSAAARRLHG